MTPLDSPRARVSELAKTVVGRLAPEELPSFDAMAAPYLTGVADTWNGQSDEPLEFGVVEAIAVITPVVTLVCASVINALMRGVEGEIAESSGRATRRLFDRWFRRRSDAGPAVWKPEQLAKVHGVALSRATALGVEPELAATIADAIAGALAVDQE